MPWGRMVDLPRRSLRRQKAELITLADRARDAGHWELAAQLYRKILDRNPGNAGIWVQYGHALKEAGELRDPDRLAQAELAYRRALSLDPGVADSHLQLGHVLKIQDRTEEARGAYLQAFALDSSLDSALFELAQLGWSETYFSELRGMLGTDFTDSSAAACVNGQFPEHSAIATIPKAPRSAKPGRPYLNSILTMPRLRPKRSGSSRITPTDPTRGAGQ